MGLKVAFLSSLFRVGVLLWCQGIWLRMVLFRQVADMMDKTYRVELIIYLGDLECSLFGT